MPINRTYRRPARYAPAAKRPQKQPLGGAVPAVQARFLRAIGSAERTEFPAMAALIYSAPSIVALPVEDSDYLAAGPGGMVDRLYQPAAPEKPRDFGMKLASWFKSGRFA